MVGVLMRAFTSELVFAQVDIAREKGVVGSWERAAILVFLPLDCVDEVVSCIACCMCVYLLNCT